MSLMSRSNQEPAKTEGPKAPETLNDVVLLMFDFSMGEVLNMIPPGMKRLVAKDAFKLARGYIEKTVQQADEQALREGFKVSARMMTEFLTRMAEWDGQKAEELMPDFSGEVLALVETNPQTPGNRNAEDESTDSHSR